MQRILTNLLRGKYIICSCEGAAEKAIIDILLDNDKLCFTREDLLRNEVTLLRSGNDIAKEFLNLQYEKEVVILRVLDRKKETFKLPKAYVGRFESYSICTHPEIEMLLIISEGHWGKFKQQAGGLKPSEYCKSVLHLKGVKSRKFIREYFCNSEDLIKTILEYKRLTTQDRETYNLADILVQK